MVEFFQFLLVVLAIALPLFGVGIADDSRLFGWVQQIAAKRRLATSAIGCLTLFGCIAVAGLLHEPVPHIHDEFSYLLMSNTLASQRISNPSPPLPEFFDTFHVLVRPVYASKYFPAQGLFLAIGEKLTGHPAVGVWLSSALACAAACWMLQAWIGPVWGLLGGLLMMIQFGVYSYWSQTYWGGMVAALGGALFFGAVRRLWDKLSWRNAIFMAVGLIIVANSRPLEGLLAALPVSCLFLWRIWQQAQWKQAAFWRSLVLPGATVLLLGAAATGTYNRAITGSAWKPPYLLHEQQYQESPQFIFLPLRPKITYSSEWLRYYYEVREVQLYISQRTPRNVMIKAAAKLVRFWMFYCGILLSAPLLLAGWLRRGWIRYAQIVLVAGFVLTAAAYTPSALAPRIAIDLLAFAQIFLFWFVFDGFWPRVAIATSSLLIFESFLLKFFFPHYFAPAACLVLFLEVEALRRMWHWHCEATLVGAANRRERRRAAARAAGAGSPRALASPWRGMAVLLPLACVVSLGLRVEARINDWSEDRNSPDMGTLRMDDWGLKRANMERWLAQQPRTQLVFVRYAPNHSVYFEWVYNKADLVHAHVIWARDLGTDHDRLLLDRFPERTAWIVDADLKDPKLIPYAEAGTSNGISPSAPRGTPEGESPD
jgi:hypothetical protein